MDKYLDRMASATPDTRDRYVDFLRAASISAVVLGHWFISINHWESERIFTTSAIGETSWLWLGTWFLQVIPIFFFVGGFANLTTYASFERRGATTRSFLRARLARLLRPALVFIGVWVVIEIVLHFVDCCGDGVFRGVKAPPATVPFGPLWFLGVYILVVLVSPVTILLQRQFGIGVPIVLLLAAIAGDAFGFLGRIRTIHKESFPVPDLGCLHQIEVAHGWIWDHFPGRVRSGGRFVCRYIDGTHTVSRHGFVDPRGTWRAPPKTSSSTATWATSSRWPEPSSTQRKTGFWTWTP